MKLIIFPPRVLQFYFGLRDFICRVFVARPSERQCDRGGRDAHDAVFSAGEEGASEGLSENVSDVVGGVALAHLDDAVDLGLAHDGVKDANALRLAGNAAAMCAVDDDPSVGVNGRGAGDVHLLLKLAEVDTQSGEGLGNAP